MLDEHLTREYHIEYICKKIVKLNGILIKLKRTSSSDALLKLYYAYIHSYLVNGIPVRASASDIHIKPLVKLQEQVC